MMVYGITAIFVVAFLFSFWRDNRSLWNPILLLLSVLLGYLSIVSFLYQSGLESAQSVIVGITMISVIALVFFSALFLIYNGIILLRREGKSKANFLSLAMGVVILLFYIVMYVRLTRATSPFQESIMMNIVIGVFTFSYLIFGFAFVAFMLYSIVYVFIPKKHHYDFIIIHGAGLLNGEQVTPLLKKRIDKAVEAFHRSKNPNVQLIASGGQGSDEKVSEATAIATYIYQHYPEIAKDRILLENRSRTTYENLKFSKEIGEKIIANPIFLFVTNDYHVFRTSMFARQLKMKGDGLACATASYYIPSAFIREFVAVCVKYRWIFIVCYLLLGLILIESYRGILW